MRRRTGGASAQRSTEWAVAIVRRSGKIYRMIMYCDSKYRKTDTPQYSTTLSVLNSLSKTDTMILSILFMGEKYGKKKMQNECGS